jgi:hypothetical protein
VRWSSERPAWRKTLAWSGWCAPAPPRVSHHLLGGGRQDRAHQRGRTLCGEAPGRGLGAAPPGDSLHEPTDLVGLACAAGGPRGLLALGGTGRAAGAPRGPTGRIPHEPPRAAVRLAPRRGDDATGTRQAGQPPRRRPASGGSACPVGAGWAPRGARLAWGCGACARPPGRGLGDSAGPTLQESLRAVSAHGVCPAGQPCSHCTDALALRQRQESLEARAQRYSTAGVGRLETAREWLAGAGAAVEGKSQERDSLRMATAGAAVPSACRFSRPLSNPAFVSSSRLFF